MASNTYRIRRDAIQRRLADAAHATPGIDQMATRQQVAVLAHYLAGRVKDVYDIPVPATLSRQGAGNLITLLVGRD